MHSTDDASLVPWIGAQLSFPYTRSDSLTPSLKVYDATIPTVLTLLKADHHTTGIALVLILEVPFWLTSSVIISYIHRVGVQISCQRCRRQQMHSGHHLLFDSILNFEYWTCPLTNSKIFSFSTEYVAVWKLKHHNSVIAIFCTYDHVLSLLCSFQL